MPNSPARAALAARPAHDANPYSEHRLLAEPEARRRLGGISHSHYYALINSGQLRTLKIGRRRFVTDEAIADLIRGLEEQAAGGAQ